MLCSVLIPSRGRAQRLLRTIESVRRTSDAKAVDILVRADDDDAATQDAVRRLIEHDTGVTLVVGSRGRGYLDLEAYYEELSAISSAPWMFVMNDDAVIEQSGEGWDSQLARMPTDGVVAHVEYYQLGPSRYTGDGVGYTFPIVPNGCWSRLGLGRIQHPIDAWLEQVLRREHGWRAEILRGVTLNHQRDSDGALAEHRRI